MKRIKTIFSFLCQVYPPYLLLLALFPSLSAYFINADLADSRNILIQLIWLPFFTITYLIFQKKWIYRLAASFYFITGSLEIIHWSLLKGPITVLSLIALVNTNPNESSESLEILLVKEPYGLLALVPFIALFIYNLWKIQEPKKENLSKLALISIALFSFAFIGENLYKQRLIRKGVPPVIGTFASFFLEMKTYEEAMKNTVARKLVVNLENPVKQQSFVLIIGESCNRNHMSLYGYSKNTNPLLIQREDIYAFSDVVSAYSNTISSVLAMLSNSNVEKPISVNESIDLIDIFHSAGYETFWISNQSPIGVWDNIITKFANKSDHKIFVNNTTNNSFEANNNASYDERLFLPFQEALKADFDKKLIIVHLMGNHVSYAKRYPAEYDLFKGEDEREKIIAHYDNSILYNDFIVDSLFKSIAKNESKACAALYLGDHGENVYDEGKNMGHDYSGKLPKVNVEIPFILWFSPSFQENNSSLVELAKNRTNSPYVSDDLFHTIQTLSGIKSELYQAERSLFDSLFLPKRRILEDGYDYDEE